MDMYPSKQYIRFFRDSRPSLDESVCVPAEKWQTEVGLDCNDIHEIDMEASLRWGKSGIGYWGRGRSAIATTSLRLLGMGGWRGAWEISNNLASNGSEQEEAVVLKMLKWDKKLDFVKETYHRHQIDAAIAGRLSSSPRVIDIYAFCGQSTLNEFASTSLLHEVKNLNKKDIPFFFNSTNKNWWPTLNRRIQYGRDAAHAVHELHSVDDHTGGLGPYNITIVHKDIKPDNFALANGVMKLNDFNDAELARYNTTLSNGDDGSGDPCRFRRDRFDPHYPSPEEALERPLTPAVDVHALGGVLYFILVGRKPFSNLNESVAFVYLTHGVLPHVPNEVWDRGGWAVEEILELARKCRSLNPSDRPKTKEVVAKIDHIYKRYNTEFGETKR